MFISHHPLVISAVIVKTGDRSVRIDGMSEAQAYWGQLSHNLKIGEFGLKDKIAKAS